MLKVWEFKNALQKYSELSVLEVSLPMAEDVELDGLQALFQIEPFYDRKPAGLKKSKTQYRYYIIINK